MYGALSAYTTLSVGGKADITVITDERQLAGIKEPTVIGRGSKLLISDRGLGGRVVVMRTSDFTIDGEIITADGGVPMPRLAQAAASRGLSGLEWACGIPGSIGGGVVMNAGAYGGSISDVLESVTVYGGGETVRGELDMAYRSCKGLPPGVITKVRLRLRHEDGNLIKERMREYLVKRAGAQPRGRGAGSSFKGQEKSAGYYLDKAGMKGMTRGGATVSEKHANFIINNGGATADDIRFLLDVGKIKVMREFHVSLEEEIIYLGEF